MMSYTRMCLQQNMTHKHTLYLIDNNADVTVLYFKKYVIHHTMEKQRKNKIMDIEVQSNS